MAHRPGRLRTTAWLFCPDQALLLLAAHIGLHDGCRIHRKVAAQGRARIAAAETISAQRVVALARQAAVRLLEAA